MKISVIVCTRDRADRLPLCLDSINQALKISRIEQAEIIIVDNGSSDNTALVAGRWSTLSAHPVSVLHEPKKGLSIARNTGIQHASGDLLVFIDDDCRMADDYIIEVIRLYAGDVEHIMRGGRIELGDRDDLPITICPDRQIKTANRRDGAAKRENLGGYFVGCHMAISRPCIDKIGFFDEALGAGTSIPGGEDTDYIYRAYLAGITIEYSPDMVVYHHHGRKTAIEGRNLFKGYMVGSGAIYAKHFFSDPNLCRQFYWDLRDAMKEIMSGKNLYMPIINFSYRDKVTYTALGAFRYLATYKRRKSDKKILSMKRAGLNA